jgi:hypothetical protein
MRLSTFLALALVAATGEARSRIQWLDRFDELRPHSAALVGCYGTASYQYVLPSIDELVAHRASLPRDAFLWSATADARRPGNVLTFDAKTGAVTSRPKLGFPSPKGRVLCKCRRDDLLHCTPTHLPPLGPRIHFSYPEGATEIAIWSDPGTGLEWHYRWTAVCWRPAKDACEREGKRLPTLRELEAAHGDLVGHPIGDRVRRAGRPVWSLDEDRADPTRAWALDFERNVALRASKDDCLTALCVREPAAAP